MLFIAERPDPAASEALKFACGLLGASGAALYRVDDAMRPYDYTLSNIPVDFHQTYIEQMSDYDPLHVGRLETGDAPVVGFDEAGARISSDDFGRYRQFMRSFRITDTMEFVFRRGRSVFAGMSVSWTDGGRADDSVGALARRIHGYLEFNLRAALPEAAPARVDGCYGLTAREWEVAELLCCGRTNPEIANRLGIGLATVKTHLIHIFDKVGAENRAAAVALFSRAARQPPLLKALPARRV